jgi:hypothetical protein
MKLLLGGAALLSAALLGIVGCSSEPKQVEIAGSVTLDNQPVQTGLIRFDPIDGENPSAEAMIEGGRYSVPLSLGKYKVFISSQKVTKMKRDVPGPGAEAEVTEEAIPARYNDNTELEVEITKDTKEQNFPLTTKRAG